MDGMRVWWDASTGAVYATQYYALGGCMCGEQRVDFVARVPR